MDVVHLCLDASFVYLLAVNENNAAKEDIEILEWAIYAHFPEYFKEDCCSKSVWVILNLADDI